MQTANCRAGSSDHGQCNRVTSPTWEPPRWSHQSISLSVLSPRFEPKDCRCEKICHWNHFSGSHDTQLTLLTVKILSQLTQPADSADPPRFAVHLFGLRRSSQATQISLSRSRNGSRKHWECRNKGIFYDLLWSSCQVSCADANMVRSRHVNRRGCK